jgi:perosamine synthetase
MRQKRLCGMDRKSQADISKYRSSTYEVRVQGYRYHMSNINAGIGLAQLAKLDGFIARRKEICQRYDACFKTHPNIKSLDIDYDHVAPHIYVILVQNGQRDHLMKYLKEKDVETSINYTPNHLHLLYRQQTRDLPYTEKAYQEILTLPLHCRLSDNDVSEVIKAVNEGLS